MGGMQCGKRRCKTDLDPVKRRQFLGETMNERHGFGGGLIHFPVADDDAGSHEASSGGMGKLPLRCTIGKCGKARKGFSLKQFQRRTTTG